MHPVWNILSEPSSIQTSFIGGLSFVLQSSSQVPLWEAFPDFSSIGCHSNSCCVCTCMGQMCLNPVRFTHWRTLFTRRCRGNPRRTGFFYGIVLHPFCPSGSHDCLLASSRQQQRARWPDKKDRGVEPNTFPSWQDELPYFWTQTRRAKGPLWKPVVVENSQALEQTGLGLNTSLSCLWVLQVTNLWEWAVNERRPQQYRPAQ